jgi:hypothetical protein
MSKITARRGRAATASGRLAPVCLCMIVRNESSVIADCLKSVQGLISHWAIVDTGSEDSTIKIVQDCLANVPGRLIESRWTDDFAFHRNQSVAAARELVADTNLRLMFIDADETLFVADETALRRKIQARRLLQWWSITGDWHFRKIGVVASDDIEKWVGARHEYLQLRPGVSTVRNNVATDAWIRYGDEGFRRRAPNFKEHDLEVLRTMMARSKDGGDAYRHRFFLARTLEAQGQWEAAVEAFATATEAVSAKSDDAWQALWGQARCAQQLCAPDVVALFQELHAAAPDRAEPLVALAGIARQSGMFKEAVTLATAALQCAMPRRTAMFDGSAYGWRAADELALAARAANDHEGLRHARDAFAEILADPESLPKDERSRLLANFEQLQRLNY